MAVDSLKRLVGTRARFQRFSDARLFSGWVVSVNPTQVRIRFAYQESLVVGQQYRFHIFGGTHDATFEGVLAEFDEREISRNLGFSNVDGTERIAVAEQTATFAIYGKLRFSPGVEARRVSADDFEIVIIHGDMEQNGVPLDKSAGGLGILVASELPQKVEVRVRMRFGLLILEADALIRSCRPSGVSDQPFRVGLEFVNPDRIFRARWATMLDAA